MRIANDKMTENLQRIARQVNIKYGMRTVIIIMFNVGCLKHLSSRNNLH